MKGWPRPEQNVGAFFLENFPPIFFPVWGGDDSPLEMVFTRQKNNEYNSCVDSCFIFRLVTITNREGGGILETSSTPHPHRQLQFLTM